MGDLCPIYVYKKTPKEMVVEMTEIHFRHLFFFILLKKIIINGGAKRPVLVAMWGGWKEGWKKDYWGGEMGDRMGL